VSGERLRVDSACDFCLIASGGSSTQPLCEGPEWVAFFPLKPATPGHTLLIPRSHVPDFLALDDDLAAKLTDAALRVGRSIETALSPDGMNFITSKGEVAEQTVFHLHLHLVPRWSNDHFGRIWKGGEQYREDVLTDAARRIREVCDAS
jgi:histidine triad (HIT) family protein